MTYEDPSASPVAATTTSSSTDTPGTEFVRERLASRLVDRPFAADFPPQDLPAAWTAPLRRLTDWLARSADRGFDARPAVRTGVVIAVVRGSAHVSQT